MRVVAVVLGILALAGTIVLVIAGESTSPRMSNAMGPLAFLLCIVAVVAMIVLGVTLGGRNNPRRAPHSPARAQSSTAQSSTAQSSTAQSSTAQSSTAQATAASAQTSAASTVDPAPRHTETDEPGDPE
jgi:hypothetical protein